MSTRTMRVSRELCAYDGCLPCPILRRACPPLDPAVALPQHVLASLSGRLVAKAPHDWQKSIAAPSSSSTKARSCPLLPTITPVSAGCDPTHISSKRRIWVSSDRAYVRHFSQHHVPFLFVQTCRREGGHGFSLRCHAVTADAPAFCSTRLRGSAFGHPPSINAMVRHTALACSSASLSRSCLAELPLS